MATFDVENLEIIISVTSKVFFGLESEIGSAVWRPNTRQTAASQYQEIKVFDKKDPVDFFVSASIIEVTEYNEDITTVSFMNQKSTLKPREEDSDSETEEDGFECIKEDVEGEENFEDLLAEVEELEREVKAAESARKEAFDRISRMKGGCLVNRD